MGAPPNLPKSDQLPELRPARMPEPRNPSIRSSGLSCFEKCPRKFLFRNRYGLVGHGRRDALDIGSTLHRTLQLLYEGNEWAAASHILETEHTARKVELEEVTDDAGFLPDATDLGVALKSLDMTHYKGIAMGRVFWKYHPLSRDKYPTLLDPSEHPFVEKFITLDLPIGGIHSTVTAQYDRVVADPNEPAVWIVDHKTTSMSPLLRAQALALSSQAQLYRLLLEAWFNEVKAVYPYYPQLRVKGIIHNIIRTPTIKYCSKDKDFPSYIERLIQWYESQPSDDPPMVQSFTLFKGDAYAPELISRLARYAKACQHAPEDLSYFWRAGDYTCHDFNSPCPYLRLCSADPALWPQLIKDHYRIEFRD